MDPASAPRPGPPTDGNPAQQGRETITRRYKAECERESDINEHLPTLASLARECPVVAEMGVRAVVSTWALLHGLMESTAASGADTARRLLCVDIEEPPEDTFREAQEAATAVSIGMEFIKGDSAKISLPADVDLLFIDTWHVYGHLRRELQQHAPRVRQYIAMHDTEVDAEVGESIRMELDIEQQIVEFGYTREEITTGLRRAVEEFLQANQGTWEVYKHHVNNNGLTVLRRVAASAASTSRLEGS